MKKHLAVFDPKVIKSIFDGKKTIDGRFSKHRIAPFNKVEVGDLVYMKPVGKDITGQFIVKKVIYFEGMEKEDFKLIMKNYGKQLGSDDRELKKFFGEKVCSDYVSLIFIDRVEQFITSPLIFKKNDRRGWVVLPADLRL